MWYPAQVIQTFSFERLLILNQGAALHSVKGESESYPAANGSGGFHHHHGIF